MKCLKLLALGGLCLSASAMAAQPTTTYTVHAPDPLAVSAIQRGDLARAEAILTSGRLDAGDPVRLINLGDVYWLSGRQNEAVAAWRRALSSRDQYDVQTAGGRLRSTDEIAREALAAHGRPMQSASN
jgi:Flp pilus assembly protein TadD